MAYLAAFGRWLPARVVSNAEVAAIAGCEPQWIAEVSGIEERRWAAPEDTVVSMGVAAARQCLDNAGVAAESLSAIFVASGTSPRRFPGPAAELAHALGLNATPAIDVPIASAGSLFALALAARLSGDVLVVASECMSRPVLAAPDRNTAILFGDGAGACLVSSSLGKLRIADWLLASDGAFAADLQLPLDAPLAMNGRTVILQATRKLPRAISDLLARQGIAPGGITQFLLHQANLNLLERVAAAVGAPFERFYANIARYGNTSSASLLIAAAEYFQAHSPAAGERFCLASFGAGFHWGALLAEAV